MNALIVYDSTYGNTEKIAVAMAEAVSGKAVRAGPFSISQGEIIDLLIVGSPTQGGRPTPAVYEFLDSLRAVLVKNMKVAAFDTRFPTRWVTIFGYAADKIAGKLKASGVALAAPPEAFFVKGKEGPLKDGELERATAWARKLAGKGE